MWVLIAKLNYDWFVKLLNIFSFLEIFKRICAAEVLGKLIFRDNSYSNNEISNEKMLKSNKIFW